MVYFSITKSVAENTGYAQLRNMILTIPYFQDFFTPNTKKSYDIEWPDKNMAIASGSNANQVIGTDVIASVIDEGDFYGSTTNTVDGKSLSKAQSLYSSILKRAHSRFMVGGRNYSLNCIISSPTYASGFITQLKDANRNNPHCYIIEETLWSVKPKGTYSDKNFVVFKGTPLLDPQIVEEVSFYNDLIITLQLPNQVFESKDPVEAYKELPPEVREHLILIPVDFYQDFKVNLVQALQDIGSVAVAPLGRLFTSEKYYRKAVQGIESPLLQDEITITTNVNDARTIQSYFKPGYVPEHPECPRYLHFDQSITNDETGVACCYLLTKTDEEGNVYKDVIVDWIVRIVPPKRPEQIDLKKVRSICYYLRDNLGLRIGKITFDSFASEESIQDLQIHGFNVSRLSLDRTDVAYTTVIQQYFTETLHHPNHKRYHEELFGLIWYREKHKVDHPPELDKGCTDALVGCVSSAITDADALFNSLRTNDVNTMLKIL